IGYLSLFFSHVAPTPETYPLSSTTLFRSPVRASPPSTGQRSPSERISRSASSAPGRSAASSSTSAPPRRMRERYGSSDAVAGMRSEEHTSELQSRGHLVCRLLLEKKKING